MKHLTLAAVIALLASPVLAAQCPADIAAIDAALAAGTDLSEEDLATVQELRDEGQAQHDAGEHDASVETLAEAKAMLGIE
ncbi:hypothetical protein [Leisingera daeponensis]|uniref:hypothetical protein n=1 Tax=Leisingera daeponensis TaxID=405746 RepID=UPI000183BCB6|nr:hypothetical protein [Leisingera daeponensis]EDZ48315.1 hypothetical protein RBY4I_3535 [Rhodobacterales bacterium Y4I]